MLAIIHTILAFTLLGVITLICVPWGLLLFPFSLIFPAVVRHIIYRTAQGWARVVIMLTLAKVTVQGAENIPKKTPVCFAANHSGVFDIVLLLAYVGRPIGFIAKLELALVPGINFWILLLGGLFINRKNLKKSLATIHKAGERIKKGGAMIIFPEGTRSRGRGLLPFKAGSLRIATEAGAVIIPVAISGSYELVEQKGILQKTDVKITFCEPIPTANLALEDRRQALADRVREAVAAQMPF
jgi:1-acyl-sn-glycerol-3-phosphate acyltransferase